MSLRDVAKQVTEEVLGESFGQHAESIRAKVHRVMEKRLSPLDCGGQEQPLRAVRVGTGNAVVVVFPKGRWLCGPRHETVTPQMLAEAGLLKKDEAIAYLLDSWGKPAKEKHVAEFKEYLRLKDKYGHCETECHDDPDR